MGNASSTNVAKIITDVHANVATAILQKQDVTLNNSQIIRIVGTTGDVNITNNTFRIKATVDMTALQTAMSDTSASSAIKNQLEQAAKTLTTGISLLQFTDARNTIDLFVKTGVELATTVAQTCSVAQNNIQEIELINTVGGNVTVAGNVFEQMASIYSNCAQNAVARNAVVQDIQNKVEATERRRFRRQVRFAGRGCLSCRHPVLGLRFQSSHYRFHERHPTPRTTYDRLLQRHDRRLRNARERLARSGKRHRRSKSQRCRLQKESTLGAVARHVGRSFGDRYRGHVFVQSTIGHSCGHACSRARSGKVICFFAIPSRDRDRIAKMTRARAITCWREACVRPRRTA